MKEVINMRKIWVMLLVGVGVLISTAYAYSYGYAETGDLQQKAEELLKSAEVKEVHSYRFDTTRHFLLKDGKVVGVIWKGAKDDVSIDRVIQTKWGAKAILTQNGEVVGQLFIDGMPGHGHARIQNTPQHDQCICCGNGQGNGHGHRYSYVGE
ncbi:hypothetical protein [Archaeoglobus neptunius]|uniref:hypothetical protein n=1 Tax=Archaeoglobus neptunius TaxID=2798580 RepID=UPI00192753CD|nr:hypothetical protein [Archaeoglobus neptunius]